jgi:chromosome segregation ATPase
MLDITSRDSNATTCVGMNRYKKRCRWDISNTSYNKICTMLDVMETRAPKEAIKSLGKLAEHSLCQEYHQYQVGELMDRWSSAIAEAEKKFDKEMILRRKRFDLEKKLNDEKAKSQELQKTVDDLQLQMRNEDWPLQVEIEILKDQLSTEHANQKSATLQLRESQKRCEAKDKLAEQYHLALLDSERKVESLTEKNAAISCQLIETEEVLEVVNKQFENTSAVSSQLQIDLSTQTSAHKRSLWECTKTVETITAERDKLHTEVAFLKFEINQMNEHSIQMSRDVDRAKIEERNISTEVDNLKRALDAESKASKIYQYSLSQALTLGDALSVEVDSLQMQMITLGSDKIAIQSQFDTETEKLEAITAEVILLKSNKDELSTEIETLRTKLASEQKAVVRLHHELNSTTGDPEAHKTSLRGAQASIQESHTHSDELMALAASREMEASTLIASLYKQIDFSKNHPFKVFFQNLAEILKIRMKSFMEWIENTRLR